LTFTHSLGAGAASIAAMELREYDNWMKVEALGFGTPSLLSPDLSKSTKDYITTVVSDSDIVPRMSGASMANMILDMVEYDWTDEAIKDVEFTLERARDVFHFRSLLPEKESVMKWVTDFLNDEVRPKLANRLQNNKDRLPALLIPPGTCVHIFRDGYGHTGTLTPCDFFSTVEVSQNIIDDHLVATGYHRALLSAAQDTDRNYTVRTSTN
jgi:Lipase (class 3)